MQQADVRGALVILTASCEILEGNRALQELLCLPPCICSCLYYRVLLLGCSATPGLRQTQIPQGYVLIVLRGGKLDPIL